MKTLKHHGVLGMHWGIRRKSRPVSSEHVKASVLKRKSVSELSNEDIKFLTNRLQLEKQYKDLKKSNMSAGEKFVSETISNVGKQLLQTYLEKAITTGVKSVFEKVKKG